MSIQYGIVECVSVCVKAFNNKIFLIRCKYLKDEYKAKQKLREKEARRRD